MYNLVNIISITKINAKLYNVSVSLTVALRFGLASPLGWQVQTETGYAFDLLRSLQDWKTCKERMRAKAYPVLVWTYQPKQR